MSSNEIHGQRSLLYDMKGRFCNRIIKRTKNNDKKNAIDFHNCTVDTSNVMGCVFRCNPRQNNNFYIVYSIKF